MNKLFSRWVVCGVFVCTQAAAQDLPRVETDPELSVLPSFFQVYGLSDGDVLNVRSGPSAKSRDLGDLVPNQKIEVTVFDVSGTWARVIWDEGNAWVSRRYLEPVATPRMKPSEIPANMLCTGTEPFWSFAVENGAVARFSAMGGDPSDNPILWNGVSANHTLRLGLATADWRAFVQKKTCSDGMSDRLYGLQIDLIGTEDKPMMLSGCCQLAEPPKTGEIAPTE